MMSHDAGHHFFTIGQRARIGGQPVAWFVVGKDTRLCWWYVGVGGNVTGYDVKRVGVG